MLENELRELVETIRRTKAEGQRLEIKAARKGCPEKLYGTLSSFSNQDSGGVIVFGVDEQAGYSVVGVYDAQDLQHRVAEQCKQMEPAVRAVFTTADMDGKTVVSAEIPGVEAASRPVFYRGAGRVRGSCIRVGEADEPMSESEIYGYEAFRRRLRDDLRPVDGATRDILDAARIAAFLAEARKNRPNLAADGSDETALERLGVTAKGVPTQAGVLLFAAYPQMFFPQLCITAVVVPGTGMGATGPDGERFLDNRRFTGPLPEMVRDACDFVSRNSRTATVIDANGKRADRPEYPPRAVREAVLNAVVHRDYGPYSVTVPVRIELYADRLEIKNEGGLFGRTDIEALGRVRPDTRNAALADMMEILHETENRYSGIPTIRTECAAAGLPEPVFSSLRGSFAVTFFPAGRAPGLSFSRGNPRASVLAFCRTPKSREEIVSFAGMSRYYVMSRFVLPLLATGKLRMTLPDKPKSKDQRFVATGMNPA